MQSWGRWLRRGVVGRGLVVGRGVVGSGLVVGRGVVGRGLVVASLLLLLVVAWRYEPYGTVFGDTACERNARLCDDAANRLAQRELGRWMLGGATLLVLGFLLVAARRVRTPRTRSAVAGPAVAGSGVAGSGVAEPRPADGPSPLARHAGVALLRGAASVGVVVVLAPFWLFGGTALYGVVTLWWLVLLAWLLDRSHRRRAPDDGDLGALLVSGAASVVGVASGTLTALALPHVVSGQGGTWFGLVPVVLAVGTGLGAVATVLVARLLAASTGRRLQGPPPAVVGAAPVAVAGVVAMVVALLVTTTPSGRDAVRTVRDDLYPSLRSTLGRPVPVPSSTIPDGGGAGRPGPTATPTPSAESVVADRPCVDRDLVLSAQGWDSAMGSSAVSVVATNTSATACWLRGYPALRLEQGGADLSLALTRSPTQPFGTGAVVPDRRVGLAARGGKASFDLWWRGYRAAADQRTPQTLVVTPTGSMTGTGTVRLSLSAPYLVDVVDGAEVTVMRWKGARAVSG